MMNKKRKFISMCFCCLLFSSTAICQETTAGKGVDELNAPHHRITIMMANTHIPSTSEAEGANKNFIVPAWGFDYDYWFNGKWAVGLHNDLILQQYKVEEVGEEKEVIRDFPVSVALVGLFKPAKHLVLVAGVGREFEKNESLNLMDIGLEYGFELPKDFELSVNLKWEHKFDAYDTYLFGIGISKVLRTKR